MSTTSSPDEAVTNNGVIFRPFQDGDAPHFYQLNVEWITKHWVLELRDHETLGSPEVHILAHGGKIFFAQVSLHT